MNFPIFRFDDVSINTDIGKLELLIDTIQHHQPNGTVLLAVSPIVFEGIGERVHPSKLTAMSTLAPYYAGTRCGVPMILREGVVLAAHGLMHVDHRLLGYKAQEMSIVGSCALVETHIFCPPYNKYNYKTEAICSEHEIELICFEDGWRHALYNHYVPQHERFYCHPYDFTPDELEAWFR